MLMFCPSETIREPAAEMLGTMILTLVGTGVNCQVVLSANTGVASSQKGDYLSLAFGWACGSSTLMFYRTSVKGHRHRCCLGCLGRWRCHWRPRESRGMLLPKVIPFPVLKRVELYR
jgi:hypothetical protein